MADTDTAETLLNRIEELTGLEQEDDETAEAYKARIVRCFSDKYPVVDDDDEDPFRKLDQDLQDWVEAATLIVKDNRGARKPKRIPELDGLTEDPAPTKATGKATGRSKAKSASEPKGTGKVGARKELASSFEAAPEGAKVSKKLTGPLRAAGFKRADEPTKAGHIVFKNEAGNEIHVGPGKGESVYMMGWRPKGDKQHQYGGPALEEYLNAL